MENNDFLEGWEFLGKIRAVDTRDSAHLTAELYGKELFGKVRYRLRWDELNDFMVVRNTASDCKYSHIAGPYAFNFEE